MCLCIVISFIFAMNQHQARNWKVLTWNVRGINSSWKWDSVKNKVICVQCDIICFQETKKDSFDSSFLRKIDPPPFDFFDFLTCVYGPCTKEGKGLFLNWFQNIQMAPEVDWMILGDFNLIRKIEDRNKPGGDLAEIFRFNATISHLGINEIVLQGRKYTWSNMQPSPLLQKLDWIFTSSSCGLSPTLALQLRPWIWFLLITAHV